MITYRTTRFISFTRYHSWLCYRSQTPSDKRLQCFFGAIPPLRFYGFSFKEVTFFPSPSLSSSSGLLVSYCGEVRRHAEGQGAAASAAAAGAADAAAQQCHHLGEPDGPGRPHPAVSGSKKSRRRRRVVARLRRHLIRPLLQPRGQRRRSQCRRTREQK